MTKYFLPDMRMDMHEATRNDGDWGAQEVREVPFLFHHAHGHSGSYRCRHQPVPTSRDNAGPLDLWCLVTKYFLSDMHMDMHGASGNDGNWGLRKFTKFPPSLCARSFRELPV